MKEHLMESFGVSKATKFQEEDYKNKQLCSRICFSKDNEAKTLLCELNSGFVYNIAKQYLGRYGSQTRMDDLIQEGYIGLLKAAEKMDVTSETTFLTYAEYWIRNYVRRASQSGYIVHIPSHAMDAIYRLLRLDQELSHEPLSVRREKECEKLNISQEQLSFLLGIIDKFLILVSTDKMIDDNEHYPLGNFVLISSEESPEQIAERKDLRRTLLKALSVLNNRERAVIIYRFGIDGGEGETFEQIARRFNVTRERIRMIEAKALRKMRFSKYRKSLEEFL